MIYKLAVLSYVLLYTGLAIGLRSYLLFRNTGINPFNSMGNSGIKGFNERVLMLGASLVPVIAAFYILPYGLYQYLVPITYIENEALKMAGILLMVFGCLIALAAQFQMGNSWRIGINEEEKTILVTSGLFRYSRNPIYLGLLISFFGFFLIIPNALSLCCLVLSYPSIEIKIRLEEQYLLTTHGENYLSYMKKVNRWL